MPGKQCTAIEQIITYIGGDSPLGFGVLKEFSIKK